MSRKSELPLPEALLGGMVPNGQYGRWGAPVLMMATRNPDEPRQLSRFWRWYLHFFG
jgi:hypothetical protein